MDLDKLLAELDGIGRIAGVGRNRIGSLKLSGKLYWISSGIFMKR